MPVSAVPRYLDADTVPTTTYGHSVSVSYPGTMQHLTRIMLAVTWCWLWYHTVLGSIGIDDEFYCVPGHNFRGSDLDMNYDLKGTDEHSKQECKKLCVSTRACTFSVLTDFGCFAKNNRGDGTDGRDSGNDRSIEACFLKEYADDNESSIALPFYPLDSQEQAKYFGSNTIANFSLQPDVNSTLLCRNLCLVQQAAGCNVASIATTTAGTQCYLQREISSVFVPDVDQSYALVGRLCFLHWCNHSLWIGLGLDGFSDSFVVYTQGQEHVRF